MARSFAGKFDLESIYGWMNPELPHNERFDRARLLSTYVEADEATYWYFLEILPPLKQTAGGFVICEATTADVHLAFYKIGARYFAAYVGLSSTDPANNFDAVRTRIGKEEAKRWASTQ